MQAIPKNRHNINDIFHDNVNCATYEKFSYLFFNLLLFSNKTYTVWVSIQGFIN